MLHFKPIFDYPLKKNIVKEARVPGAGYASKTWSFSSAWKFGGEAPPRAEIWLYQ